MRLFTSILLVLLLICSPARAQWYDRNTGIVAADTASKKSLGDVGTALVLLNDGPSFIHEWNTTNESHAPKIPKLVPVKRGNSVWSMLLFTGCGNESSYCNAEVDFKVYKPDGSLYGERINNRVWTSKGVRKGVILLSQSFLQIAIEPKDPLGSYKVVGSYRDESTAIKLEMEKFFEVIE